MVIVRIDLNAAFNTFRSAMNDDLGLALFNIRPRFAKLIQIIGDSITFLIA
ncbi:hypothetical protein D3C78_1821810 [compost metagenome]